MPQRPTITIVPTSEQRRALRQWAGPRGIPTLPGNGFAVPAELLPEIPLELILGARVNGEVYLPAAGQVYHDAPPLEDPLEAALTAHELTTPELDALGEDSPPEPLDVVAGFPAPRADDIPTTGAPALDPDDSP